MIIQKGPATHIIPVKGKQPITFIATPKIVADTDPGAITQAINANLAKTVATLKARFVIKDPS